MTIGTGIQPIEDGFDALPTGEKIRVTFLPHKQTVEAARGGNLLEFAHSVHIDLENACNAGGTCGKCKIQILEGEVSPLTGEELRLLSPSEVSRGVRLACRVQALGDVRVRVVREIDGSRLRIVEESLHREYAVHGPTVGKVFVELAAPSLKDNLADTERVVRGVGQEFSPQTTLSALRALPVTLRSSAFKVTAVLADDRIIGIEAGDTSGECYGVAVDIGTTTVVASLIDIATGREVGTASAANPQGRYGQDVVTRIQYAEQEEGLNRLQRLIQRQINELVTVVCTEAGVAPKRVYELAIAGNAAMLHLFLGVAPASLGLSPYVTAFREGVTINSSELGVGIADFGRVYLLPSISGYVGADIVAGVIATGLHESEAPALLVDIGTNGEIVFGSRSGLVACSCAAGPALEGMNISCGTVAVAGAIERIVIGDTVEIGTVDDGAPVGICGSGIIDAVAELLRNGIIDSSGRFLERDEFLAAGGRAAIAGRIETDGEIIRFALTDHIFISQKDVRQVQLAKGAISSGIRVLMQEVGVEAAAIARVYVAGAFGKHLRLESLMRIGLIPEELADKVLFVGNTAKSGAAMSLLSGDRRSEEEKIARKTRFFELSIYPGYEKLFVKSVAFPKG